jgi:capsular exopolysaccharide synthesis family protein
MNARSYARAIRKSWWIIIIAAILGAAVGYGYSKAQTKLYASHLTFWVATPTLNGQDANANNQFAQERAASYAALLTSDSLARRVINDTGLHISASTLSKEISASAELNTILIDVTVTDADPDQAFRIAKSVGAQFPSLVNDLDNRARAGGSAVSLRVVSGPTRSGVPVSPRTKLNVLLGFALGLLVGLGLAVLRETLDVSVRGVDSMRELTGAPMLASIPYSSSVRTQPLVLQESTYSTRAEALRQLRTNLQFLDAAHPARVIVITSAVAGEGKSLVALNLALVTAEAGRSVVVIEADLRKPRISDLLGLDRSVGLSTVLAGQASYEDAVQRWGSTRLDVLSSGMPPPNPSELIDSARMTELIEGLRELYDMVVIDTPPLVPVTDAAIIAAQVDGAVLVIRHGRTRRGHLRTAIASLDAVHARLLGGVMNMTALRRADRRGYDAYLDYQPGDETKVSRFRFRPKRAKAEGWVPPAAAAKDETTQDAEQDKRAAPETRPTGAANGTSGRGRTAREVGARAGKQSDRRRSG